MPKHRNNLTRLVPAQGMPPLRRNVFASAIAAGLFVLPTACTWAATITVDGSSCSLANSIIAANTDTTAAGACIPGGSGADTLVLPGNITLNGDLPPVTSTITIQGNGAAVMRNPAAAAFRIFTVDSSGDLTLQDLTVSGGSVATNGGGIESEGALRLIDSTVSGNSAGVHGGGLSVLAGMLSLNRSSVSNNNAVSYGGGIILNGTASAEIRNSTVSGNTCGDYGGGIELYTSSTSLTLTGSTVTGNLSGIGGGGIQSYGTLTVTDSTVSGNTAALSGDGDGGGIFSDGGATTVTDSTISGNSTGRDGGGIYIPNGSLLLSRSTVSGNLAVNGGGGIFNTSGDSLSSVVVSHSTISGNTAAGRPGGGIYNRGEMTLTDSTVTGNLSQGGEGSGGGVYNDIGTLVLRNSIVSGNSATEQGAEINNDPFGIPGTVINQGGNVLGHSAGPICLNALVNFPFGPNDFFACGGEGSSGPTLLANILVTSLADNGGPTLTHALPAGSPAIDRNACSGVTDQRGVNRPKGAACDSGAYEVGNNFINAALTKTSTGPVTVGDNLTYNLVVTNTGAELASDVQVFDTLPASLIFVSATPSQGECEFEMGVLSCELDDIAGGGGSASVQLVAKTTLAGAVTNTASFTTDIIDVNANTDFDDDDTTNVVAPNPPKLSFLVGSSAVGEAAGARTLTVQLSEISGANTTVPFTVSGTASAADYTGLSVSPLVIPAGSLSAAISFSIVNDNLVEADEQLIFTLKTPTGATLGSISKSLLTIKDNDAPPPDTTPNAFNFTDKKGVKAKTDITSNTVTVSGLSNGTSTTVILTNGSGGDASYSINGAAFRKTPATVKNGDTVRLRNRIPGNSGTANATLTIGGVSDAWKITTSR